jgi:hypothetical protein
MAVPAALINNGAVAEVTVQGPAYQWQVPAATINTPGTIAASGTFNSPVLLALGMPHLAVSAQINQAGTLEIQRYLDNAGSISTGTLITKALTSGTLAVADNNDGTLFQSFTIGIVNSGGTAATVSNVAAVLQSR